MATMSKDSDQSWVIVGITLVALGSLSWVFFVPFLERAIAILVLIELKGLMLIDALFNQTYSAKLITGTKLDQSLLFDLKRQLHLWYAVPVALIILWSAWQTLRSSHGVKRGLLAVSELDIFISRFYFPSRPVVGRALENRHPLDDPLWRFARKPWEFAMEQEVLVLKNEPFTATRDDSGLAWLKPSKEQCEHIRLDPARASKVFSQQLGPALGKNPDLTDFAQEYRAVAVAILAETKPEFARKFGSSHRWLKQFASSFWDLKKLRSGLDTSRLPPFRRTTLDMTGVNDALCWAASAGLLDQFCGRSAYLHCLLADLFARTRLTTSKLIWLKPINRTFFYTLNNVGRPRRLHIEAHAPFAHLEFERKLGRVSVTPQVAASIQGLEAELKRHGWIL